MHRFDMLALTGQQIRKIYVVKDVSYTLFAAAILHILRNLLKSKLPDKCQILT